MLFISILLVIWFVLWLISAVHTKDVLQIFVAWMEMTSDDENDDIDILLEKSEDKTAYHLYCDKCNHAWWATSADTNYCPNCGEKRK